MHSRKVQPSLSCNVKPLFLERDTWQWRKKPIESVPRQLTSNDHAMSKENHGTHTQLSAQTKMKVPSTKEVLQDLEEATTQYLSCPDPMEAASRKQ